MNSNKSKYDDGLEWLRDIRRKIWDECDHDVKKLMQRYREAHEREVERRKHQGMALREKPNQS